MPLTSLTNQQIPSAEAAVQLNTLYEGLGDQQRDFRNANLIRLICGYIQGSRVLDVGCGAGRLLNALKQEGFSPVGIEPDKDLISLAERMNPELKIYQGEGDRLATIPEQFETITIIDVLEHIEDDVSQLELMYDRLEEGGRLVVVVPAHQWLYGKRIKTSVIIVGTLEKSWLIAFNRLALKYSPPVSGTCWEWLLTGFQNES